MGLISLNTNIDLVIGLARVHREVILIGGLLIDGFKVGVVMLVLRLFLFVGLRAVTLHTKLICPLKVRRSHELSLWLFFDREFIHWKRLGFWLIWVDN